MSQLNTTSYATAQTVARSLLNQSCPTRPYVVSRGHERRTRITEGSPRHSVYGTQPRAAALSCAFVLARSSESNACFRDNSDASSAAMHLPPRDQAAFEARRTGARKARAAGAGKRRVRGFDACLRARAREARAESHRSAPNISPRHTISGHWPNSEWRVWPVDSLDCCVQNPPSLCRAR